MSRLARRHPRTALWHMVLTWLLIAAVAYAPVARAVCSLEHIGAVGADLHQDAAQADDASGSPTDEHDLCCDDGFASMTAQDGSVDDRGASVAPSILHFATAGGRTVALPAYIAPDGGRRLLPPPDEPILRRLPKLLI